MESGMKHGKLQRVARTEGYALVRARVCELDKKLRADDPRFRNSITVYHEEGTMMHFEWAFAIKFERWYVIFTEHHGYHIYDEDDVQVIMRGERLEIPEQEIPNE